MQNFLPEGFPNCFDSDPGQWAASNPNEVFDFKQTEW
jgi:hypothetical protein